MLIYHRLKNYDLLDFLAYRNYSVDVSVLCCDIARDERWLSVRQHKGCKRVFFDRAVFEGTPIDIQTYLTWVKMLRPHLWVLPDVLDSLRDTLELVVSLELDSTLLRLPKALVVADMPSPYEITRIKQLISKHNITHIGIPYRNYNSPTQFLNRLGIAATFPNMKIHFLGIERASELGTLALLNASADTNLALATTMDGQRWPHVYSKRPILCNDSTSFEYELFFNNLRWIDLHCRYLERLRKCSLRSKTKTSQK
jgi:hypothetical protein